MAEPTISSRLSLILATAAVVLFAELWPSAAAAGVATGDVAVPGVVHGGEADLVDLSRPRHRSTYTDPATMPSGGTAGPVVLGRRRLGSG